MSVDDDGQIATKLRALLDKDSGLKATKIIGLYVSVCCERLCALMGGAVSTTGYIPCL
jgi:hypothetical protein